MLLKLLHVRHHRLARQGTLVAGLVAVLLMLVWFTPALVASRWCWPLVLTRLTAGFDGQVSSRGVTLGWLSPVVVDGLHVQDRHGGPLVEVESLRTETSLLALLWNARELGPIRIEKPALTVVLRDDGSNLEDALATLLQRRTSSTSRGSLEIVAGRIDVHDAAGQLARLDDIQAAIALPSPGSGAGEVRLEQCRVTTGSRTGDCVGRVTWQSGEPAPSWSASIRATTIGVSLLQAVASRLGVEVRADGQLTADLDCRGDGVQGTFAVDVRQADARPLQLIAPQWLGEDRLELQELRVSGSCSVKDGRWEFRQAAVDCDAGRFTIDGDLVWQPQAGASMWRQLLDSAAAANLQLDGQVDLARLAALLPHTLRIREGATIESGTLHVQLSSRQGPAERQWLARLETTDVAASREGRRFSWTEPLQIHLEAKQDDQGWHVQRLIGQSPFIQIQGQGTAHTGTLELACDVNQLLGELRQLFELGDFHAGGAARAHLRWTRADADRIAVEGTGTLESLEVADARGAGWRESRLEAKLTAEAVTDGQRLSTLRNARVELISAAGDRLELQLLEPVAQLGADAAWSLGCQLRGEWATWLARVSPWVGIGTVEGSGTGQLTFTARLTPQRWDVQKLMLRGERIRWTSSLLEVDEPTVQLELDGGWDRMARQWQVTHAVFQSSAVAFRVNDAGVNQDGAPTRVTGELSFRADLARLQSSWRLATAPPDWRASGAAQGQVSLVQHEGNTQARWSIDVAAAELLRRAATTAPTMANVIPTTATAAWQTVWSEPSIKLIGSGEYHASRETVQLDRLDIAVADHLRVSTEGSLVRPWSQCDVDLKGRVTYDLARLGHRLWPSSVMRLTGQDTQPFWLRGPLFHTDNVADAPPLTATTASRGWVRPELLARAALRWQSANAFGVVVGPGLVSARLTAGTVESDVIETGLSGGTLRIAPRVRLNSDPPLLTAEPGQILTNVRITPGMCQDWLKYVAPLAADATQAEGTFSLSLERAAVPLGQPATSDVRGVLSVEAAQIGPGSLAMQLVELGERIKALVQGRLPADTTRHPDSWVTLPPQQTRFQFVDGRVHHDRCEFHLGDTIVRTRGSVGLDQSLALIAEVPIPESWLTRDPRLAVLRGTTLEIPIAGTFQRPRLDAQALEQLSTQVLQQTANRMLEEGVQRGLQQLLGPRR